MIQINNIFSCYSSIDSPLPSPFFPYFSLLPPFTTTRMHPIEQVGQLNRKPKNKILLKVIASECCEFYF
jgi:hypothetical protein